MKSAIKKDAIDLVLDQYENDLKKIIENTDVQYQEKYSSQFKDAQATYNYLTPIKEANGIMIYQCFDSWRKAGLLKMRHRKQYMEIEKLEDKVKELNKIHEFNKSKF